MNLELPLDAVRGEDRPLSVRAVVEGARLLLEEHFPVVWVEGEISSFKAWPSGHWYFTLKDREAQVRCVMFRLDARRARGEPVEGVKVYARGSLSVGTRRGDLQFVVRELIPTTEGGFHAARLERARLALERDGLLDPARKRRLPPFPACVGVVTSPEGAAWHDVVAVVGRRWPACELVLVGARVQGDDAPGELTRALERAARHPALELLIIGRGGGSKEDLWAFNEERVARAVAASPVPVISAVGHEIDVTLTDLVADVRAATPSAAAETAVPDRSDVARRLHAVRQHLARAAGRRLDAAAARLAMARRRIEDALERRVLRAGAAIERLAAALDALSPLRVLERGYAVARGADGGVLRRVADFPPGRRFALRVSDGEVPARSEGAT